MLTNIAMISSERAVMVIQQPRRVDSGVRQKWFSSPVTFHQGTLADVRSHIPDFERRSFSLVQPGGAHTCPNERFDTIVRLPFEGDGNFIPVGVVSKEYTLVPHSAVFDMAVKALESANIKPADVKSEIRISEYGERMELSCYLPNEYSFDPGDGYPMALRLECLNSVDGSTRFRALMGWFRFVCNNGLVIGVTRSDVRRRHVGEPPLEEVGRVFAQGLAESETEKKTFELWRNKDADRDIIAQWADNDLREGWGFKAAARAFHIARCGSDAEVLGPYKGNTPTSIAMQKTIRISGAPDRSRNLFDLSQILAWLAKERRDVQEQLEWREKIPGLMAPLMN
jgi:hypothetical protein